jgi:hypothetical protein
MKSSTDIVPDEIVSGGGMGVPVICVCPPRLG